MLNMLNCVNTLLHYYMSYTKYIYIYVPREWSGRQVRRVIVLYLRSICAQIHSQSESVGTHKSPRLEFRLREEVPHTESGTLQVIALSHSRAHT